MNGTQLVTDVFMLFIGTVMATIIFFNRGSARRLAFIVLAASSFVALYAWTQKGQFQEVHVDADLSDSSPSRKKLTQHRPLHFHEFVHYYLGPKYFPEMGYLGLYGCVTLADAEVAVEDKRAPRISGGVRDLKDILFDRTHEEAMTECRTGAQTRFTDARWAEFKNDIRELGRITDDRSWNPVVQDAGFNPPPSLILLSYSVTNLVPIRSGSVHTYLFATCIDLVLLVVCFVLMRRALGDITTAVFVLFFGATFLADYTWNGGSVLRFTWFVSLVLGVVALKRSRWELAGALLGWAACDRIFPVMFAAAAMAPIALQARHSAEHRAILRRFGIGFGGVVAVLLIASVAVFGVSSWTVFFERIINHDNVYHPQHVALKKVMTFREWVPYKHFGGPGGNERYREWNLRLRETWSSMRPIVLPIQALVAAATAWACTKRRPHEAAILGGIVFMFVFSLPANYYWCILALVPTFTLRSAVTATSPDKRWRDFGIFLAFALFWTFTFLASLLPSDDLTRVFRVSTAMFVFLLGWIAVWSGIRPTTWGVWKHVFKD